MLPSPFLPDVAYEPWVASLGRRGLEVALAPVPSPPRGEELCRVWSELADGDTVLLPHSNAGYLAPVVSDASDGAPIVFVDAALPEPGPVTRLAPEGFRDFLAGIADEHGMLPPWTRWWPRADYDAVLPGDWFDEVDVAAPMVPLSYVDAEVTLPPTWERGQRAYLAFGDTYADEWDRAGRAGWHRRRLGGGHLHWLVEPEVTAGVTAALVHEVRARPR